MQPYFFPFIGYFQLIKSVDKFVVYDDVNYINRGYINRNSIYDCNKGSKYINILLSKASQNKQIREIELDNTSKWKDKLLKQITQTYRKAPYFDNVYTVIEKIINYPENNLSSFLFHSIKQVCLYLQIDTELIASSIKYNNKGLDRADRLIDICKQEKCFKYINSIGGMKLYDKTYFKNNGVDLLFLKTGSIEYRQFGNEFIPSLSIIDVMMHNSVEEISEMLNKHELL